MLADKVGCSGAALIRAAVLFVVIALAGARHVEAAETEAALPPPPAFHTKYLSAVSDIKGDSFRLQWQGQKTTIRLRDADCSELDPERLPSAVFLAAQLLEEEPFWIFPCAPLNPGAPGEVRARVWTKKGWLSEILIKSNLAKRRSDVAAEPFIPAEAPPAAAPAAVPPPPPPAFAATVQQIVAGDIFEVPREGKTVRIRLYDAICVGASEDAKLAAAKAIGTNPVWIFPSSQWKLDAASDLPVRIWTREGWLADVLVKASAAKYHNDPDKALGVRTEKQGEAPAQPPAQPADRKPSLPAQPRMVWHRVNVPIALKGTHTIESGVFEVPVAEWRFSWNLKRVMRLAGILINIVYVDPRYSEVTRSTTPVTSFTADQGSAIIHHAPGQFLLHVTGATDLNVVVEYLESTASPAP